MSFFCDFCPECGARIEVRTQGQNGAFHALCSEIDTQLDWPRGSGNKIGVLPWKRLLISGWEKAHGRPAEFFPAIDGKGFDVVYRRSSRLSKKEMSDLIQFGSAWASENGVVLRDPEAEEREAFEQLGR